MSAMETNTGQHLGGCHCGAVRFSVNLPADVLVRRCNCSICAMKGVVMMDVPLEALTITQGEDALSIYRFNSGEAKHYFCGACGIHSFHQTRSDPDKYGVNAACVDGISPFDWSDVPVFDGQNHPADSGKSGCVGTVNFKRTAE